jgi:hypothetical protein
VESQSDVQGTLALARCLAVFLHLVVATRSDVLAHHPVAKSLAEAESQSDVPDSQG